MDRCLFPFGECLRHISRLGIFYYLCSFGSIVRVMRAGVAQWQSGCFIRVCRWVYMPTALAKRTVARLVK